MRKRKRLWTVLGVSLAALVALPVGLWFSLTHQPAFYRSRAAMPSARRQSEAKRFVSQSLQLRNDIVNEPRWEAAFTDEEVNAWLAEDLVTHFADRIPDGVQEPRVAFETDRLVMAFQLQEGPVKSVVWVVVRVRVPEGNVLALTLEKVRAGLVPLPAERLINRITDHARAMGLDVRWERDGEYPVALVRFTPDAKRRDIVLERLQLLDGQIRLSGRSNRAGGSIASPTLPNRRVLQSTFPRRKTQPPASTAPFDRDSSWRARSSTTPLI